MKKTTLMITVLSLLVVAVLIISGFPGGITGGTITCNTPYLLVGTECCLDSNDNKICDKDETEPDAEPVEQQKEEVTAITEQTTEIPQTTNEFKMKLGESVNFDGKTVTLVEVANLPNLRGTYNVDGIERDVYSTKEMELVNGIKITNLKYFNLENGFLVKLEKLVLGEGEYLMNTREDLTIQGKTFTLGDVTESEDVRKINLIITGPDIESGKLILEEGETEIFEGLEITNLYAFPSGYKLDRLAIIKVQ